MSLSEESTERIEAIADEALSKLGVISHAAKGWLKGEHQLGSDSLASVNTQNRNAIGNSRTYVCNCAWAAATSATALPAFFNSTMLTGIPLQ